MVIGASEKPIRVSHRAIERLLKNNIETVAIGSRKGRVESVEITDEKKIFENIHTVTLYINPQIQKEYEDYIIGLKPKRIIFNPGTENFEFRKKAAEAGIDTLEACTLVMLSTGQY